jgi:hypothetical protein
VDIRGGSFGEAGALGLRPLRKQAEPHVLGGVGVLVLVDEDVSEFPVVFGQHVRVVAEDADRVAQQVAEVAGVQGLQAVLVGLEQFTALAVGESAGVAFRDVLRAEALVLPAVDHLREGARRPALVVEALGLDDLLEQADLVVGVEDGEVGPEAGQFGVAAQDLDADGVEGAEPGHALDRLADEKADALLHLAGGLVGEGDGEDLARPGEAEREDVGDAGGQHAGLAGAGAGQHEDGALGRLDGAALLLVQAIEIIGALRLPRGHGAGGNTAGRGAGRLVAEGDVVERIAHLPAM